MNAQAYVAAVFFPDGSGKATGETPEAALRNLASLLLDPLPLTYRPIDGMVYQNGNHIPCGIVFANPDSPVCTRGPAGANVDTYCGKPAAINTPHGHRCAEHKGG